MIKPPRRNPRGLFYYSEKSDFTILILIIPRSIVITNVSLKSGSGGGNSIPNIIPAIK
jgi:hypothetical protein